jgi:hypothetical protein
MISPDFPKRPDWLSLSLLVLGDDADHPHDSVALDDLALGANLLDR